jgi:hypothetical protein
MTPARTNTTQPIVLGLLMGLTVTQHSHALCGAVPASSRRPEFGYGVVIVLLVLVWMVAVIYSWFATTDIPTGPPSP